MSHARVVFNIRNLSDIYIINLRYPWGFPTNASRFGLVLPKFIIDDVDCVGTEQSLFDCGFNSTNNCGSHEAAGVLCSGIALFRDLLLNE